MFNYNVGRDKTDKAKETKLMLIYSNISIGKYMLKTFWNKEHEESKPNLLKTSDIHLIAMRKTNFNY